MRDSRTLTAKGVARLIHYCLTNVYNDETAAEKAEEIEELFLDGAMAMGHDVDDVDGYRRVWLEKRSRFACDVADELAELTKPRCVGSK